MFNSINKKVIGIIALLFLCTVMTSIVGVWSVRKQGNYIQAIAEDIQKLMEKTEGLSTKLNETADNSVRIDEMAGKLGENFKISQQLMQLMRDSDSTSREIQISNMTGLASTALKLLDNYLDTAKFLSDAAIKSRDVRDNAAGFFQASIKDMGGTPEQEHSPDQNPHNNQSVLNDFVDSLVSSANAHFYAVISLKGDFKGKGLYSNQEKFFGADLSNNNLYKLAIRENRIAKSIDRFGDELILAANAFLKSDKGTDLGIIICGFWFDISMLRFLSEDLNANMALFIADKDGKIGKAKYSTLTKQNGELLTDVHIPSDLSANFDQKLSAFKEKSQKENIPIDGRSLRNNFVEVREVEMGGLTYLVAYQALLSDDAELHGVLTIARDISLIVKKGNEITKKMNAEVENAKQMDNSRIEIADATKKSREKAKLLLDETNKSRDGLNTTINNVKQVARTTGKAIGIVVTVALVIAVLISILVNRIITKPIGIVIDGLSNASDQLTSAARQVASAGQDISKGAAEQASSLGETSSLLDQMASVTQKNAEDAVYANTLMKETKQVVDRANESLNQLIRSMEEISAANVQSSKIIKTIDEIAFQTNLLSLNAAVEAARAGEAGAGFAVVASEVRNLALRATQEAKNTTDLLETTLMKTHEGSKFVKETSEAFAEVTKSAAKVSEIVNDISVASNEQAEGIVQASSTVADTDKVTQLNASNSQQSAAASEELRDQAELLKNFVEKLAAIVGGNRNAVEE